MDLGVFPFRLKYQTVGDKLGQRFVESGNVGLNLLLRQPPLGNAQERVLSVRILREIFEYRPDYLRSSHFVHRIQFCVREIAAITAPRISFPDNLLKGGRSWRGEGGWSWTFEIHARTKLS